MLPVTADSAAASSADATAVPAPVPTPTGRSTAANEGGGALTLRGEEKAKASEKVAMAPFLAPCLACLLAPIMTCTFLAPSRTIPRVGVWRCRLRLGGRCTGRGASHVFMGTLALRL